MDVRKINIDQLYEYINAAFFQDGDLLLYYDKGENVSTIEEVSNNIFLKIQKHYPDAEIYGIDENNFPIGYFVFQGTLLVSFGLDIKKRTKENLINFWEIIKRTIGCEFQSILYSYNDRAISFLKKCGMDIVFENVTVLQYN